jgi:hypothetical protein
MSPGTTKMKFAFSPTSPTEKSLILVTNIVGKVWFKVQQKSELLNSSVLCDSNSVLKQEQLYCEVMTNSDEVYIVTVSSVPDGSTNKFVISYTDDNMCQYYPIDYPLTMQLDMVEGDGDY